jgi:hypothetical protein
VDEEDEMKNKATEVRTGVGGGVMKGQKKIK